MAFNDGSLQTPGSTGLGSYPLSGWFTDPNWSTVTGTSVFTPAPSPTAVSTATGVSPLETSYSLYGHTIPLSVFGVGRIGGEIISGPWVVDGKASFIISFGVPADPSGTRILREIAFDSEVVWTGSLTGSGTPSSGGFSSEPITCRFYDGTLTQSADALETSHFSGDAVAYRPQMLLAFENLPLANTKFHKIPYVAAVIADTSGDDVNLGEAFERLAYSPWVGYTSDQFETVGITDGLVSGGLIIADQAEFLGTIQQFGRFYPKWSILQTDKLRIVDRGSNVTPDVVLTRERLVDKTTLIRQEPNSVPSILDLSTIDPAADYTIVPSRAQSPRAPVAVTSSVKTDSAYLPVIMDAATRISLVTYAKHHEDRARKQISATAMLYGLELEPGDYVGVAGLGTDFPGGETFRVLETLHGANYVVEFTAESILQCDVQSLTTTPPPPPVLGATIWDAASNTDPSHITLSNANLTASNDGSNSADHGIRVTNSRNSGKRYFEVTVGVFDGDAFSNCGIGLTIPTQDLDTATNFDVNPALSGQSFWVRHTGSMVLRGSTTGFSLSAIPGTNIGFAVDFGHMKIWVRKDGGIWEAHGGDDPATNTGGIDISALGSELYPFLATEHLRVAQVTANFGASSFAYALPFGFVAWDSV